MTPWESRAWTYAFGSTIDSSVKSSSGFCWLGVGRELIGVRPPFLLPRRPSACGSSRSRCCRRRSPAWPGVAVQRLPWCSPRRRRRLAPSRSPRCASARGRARRARCRSPDVPTFVGVITSSVSWPGNASCSARIGNPERVDHVVRGQVQLDGAADGRRSCAEVMSSGPDSRTSRRTGARSRSTFSGFEPAPVVLDEHDAAHHRDAVTRIAGTAVQAISIPVCPWIGGPSESSSGRARNFITRVGDHREDEGKDRDADRGREPEDEVDPVALLRGAGGSQGTSRATTVATAPTRPPRSGSWRIEPLRIGDEPKATTWRAAVTEPPSTSFSTMKGGSYGTRSQLDLDRRRRHPTSRWTSTTKA